MITSTKTKTLNDFLTFKALSLAEYFSENDNKAYAEYTDIFEKGTMRWQSIEKGMQGQFTHLIEKKYVALVLDKERKNGHPYLCEKDIPKKGAALYLNELKYKLYILNQIASIVELVLAISQKKPSKNSQAEEAKLRTILQEAHDALFFKDFIVVRLSNNTKNVVGSEYINQLYTSLGWALDEQSIKNNPFKKKIRPLINRYLEYLFNQGESESVEIELELDAYVLEVYSPLHGELAGILSQLEAQYELPIQFGNFETRDAVQRDQLSEDETVFLLTAAVLKWDNSVKLSDLSALRALKDGCFMLDYTSATNVTPQLGQYMSLSHYSNKKEGILNPIELEVVSYPKSKLDGISTPSPSGARKPRRNTKENKGGHTPTIKERSERSNRITLLKQYAGREYHSSALETIKQMSNNIFQIKALMKKLPEKCLLEEASFKSFAQYESDINALQHKYHDQLDYINSYNPNDEQKNEQAIKARIQGDKKDWDNGEPVRRVLSDGIDALLLFASARLQAFEEQEALQKQKQLDEVEKELQKEAAKLTIESRKTDFLTKATEIYNETVNPLNNTDLNCSNLISGIDRDTLSESCRAHILSYEQQRISVKKLDSELESFINNCVDNFAMVPESAQEEQKEKLQLYHQKLSASYKAIQALYDNIYEAVTTQQACFEKEMNALNDRKETKTQENRKASEGFTCFIVVAKNNYPDEFYQLKVQQQKIAGLSRSIKRNLQAAKSLNQLKKFKELDTTLCAVKKLSDEFDELSSEYTKSIKNLQSRCLLEKQSSIDNALSNETMRLVERYNSQGCKLRTALANSEMFDIATSSLAIKQMMIEQFEHVKNGTTYFHYFRALRNGLVHYSKQYGNNYYTQLASVANIMAEYTRLNIEKFEFERQLQDACGKFGIVTTELDCQVCLTDDDFNALFPLRMKQLILVYLDTLAQVEEHAENNEMLKSNKVIGYALSEVIQLFSDADQQDNKKAIYDRLNELKKGISFGDLIRLRNRISHSVDNYQQQLNKLNFAELVTLLDEFQEVSQLPEYAAKRLSP